MKAIALGLVLVSCVVATPAPLEERYPQCGDPCYTQVRKNQLLGYQSKAACKELFQQTVYPCTVTSTSSIEWKGYGYGYRPCGPSLTTKTIEQTLTTVTTTSTSITLLARNPTSCTPTTKSTTAVPTYFASCKNVAQYSSACSCLQNTHSVVAKPTPTTTVYHVGCSTSTSTTYTTVATEYSSTETDTVTSTAPICAQTITAYKGNGESKGYKMKYHGWGKVSDPDDNRYNQDPDHTPTIDYFDDSDDDCSIIQQCANKAYQNSDEYYMFDLHYKNNEWVCVQYYQGSGDSSNFDVDDSDATKVYGYQIDYYY